jgi:hypothetical protein
VLQAASNTNINATKLHDPPHFHHAFAVKKNRIFSSERQQTTQKNQGDPQKTSNQPQQTTNAEDSFYPHPIGLSSPIDLSHSRKTRADKRAYFTFVGSHPSAPAR